MSNTSTACHSIASTDSPSTHRPSFKVIEGGLSANQAGRVQRSCRAASSTLPIVFLIAVFMLTISVLWGVSDAMTHHRVSSSLQGATMQTVTVVSGDTLWNIAERHPLDGCTTSELVHAIVEINGLEGASLSSGMKIEVPVRA